MDNEEDRRRAQELASAVPEEDVVGSVRFVFGRRDNWSEELIDRRVNQVLGAADRLRGELGEWLLPVKRQNGPLLDLGCGPGMLLAALGTANPVIGIDVSVEWLIVARRISRAAGVQADVAAGHAEALPLAGETMAGVCALDVLEHVGDQATTIREVDRVLKPGGIFAAATPNRFSMAAEPHVGIWGVGWLPRKWQSEYVRRRTGLPYAFTRLLSARELDGLVADNSHLEGTAVAASIPGFEISRMNARRRVLARTYNKVIEIPGACAIARHLGPFFHLTATKVRMVLAWIALSFDEWEGAMDVIMSLPV